MWFLNLMIVLLIIFWGISKLFHKCYAILNSYQQSTKVPLLQILASICFGVFLNNAYPERWYLLLTSFPFHWYLVIFPDSSVGKESACNAGDPDSIPGSGRSAGERLGYPLQYSWSSLVAQLVKNPSAMWDTWVPSLGWKDPLEKGKATHSSILA